MPDSPLPSPSRKRVRKMPSRQGDDGEGEREQQSKATSNVSSNNGIRDNIRLERNTNITPLVSSQSSTSCSSVLEALDVEDPTIDRRTQNASSSQEIEDQLNACNSSQDTQSSKPSRNSRSPADLEEQMRTCPFLDNPNRNHDTDSNVDAEQEAQNRLSVPGPFVEMTSSSSSSNASVEDEEYNRDDVEDILSSADSSSSSSSLRSSDLPENNIDYEDAWDNDFSLADVLELQIRGYYESDQLDYDSDQSDMTIRNVMPEEYLSHDPTPNTQYPRPEWITVNQLLQRKRGLGRLPHQTSAYWFEKHASNSLWMIQRLELSRRLEEHRGCVNCLSFNQSGNLLCSGSDDRKVCIWDWQGNKLVKKLNTEHSRNIVCCSFADGDRQVITSSRDGRVCIVDIESGKSEVLLADSREEIGRFAFLSPQTLVTCGTSAKVKHIDLRSSQHEQLFQVKNPTNHRYNVGLYTISSHPIDKHQLITAGMSPYVFLYDLRFPDRFKSPLAYCISPKENRNNIITSTEFNERGDKFLVSYNDGDLFACKSSNCDMIHKYTGHMNRKTIKGCAWFGDDFVLSGSDDGHIYGWDLESEHIVCFLEADLRGVVNSLVVHPKLPVLASSGLEHNVKVWEPTSKEWPQTLKGIKPQICMNALRRKRKSDRRTMRVMLLGDTEGNSSGDDADEEDDPFMEEEQDGEVRS